MLGFLKDVKDIKFPVILLILGFIFIIVSFFKVDDITKLQITPNNNPILIILIIGIILIALSIGSHLLSDDSIELKWLKPNKIDRKEDGYLVKLGQAVINVTYGRIENCNFDEQSLIALPANEFFDKDCITDKNTSLGSFIRSKFPNQTEEIIKLIQEKKNVLPSSKVEKEVGKFEDSCCIGTSIFLDKPLSSDCKLIITAVTTKRAGKGLQSKILYIFQAIREIYKIMVDNRITKIYLPLMGAGKGCLRNEVSLFVLMLAWTEIVCSPLSQKMEINIIVFRADEKAKPELSSKVIKRILYIATGMFKI